MSKAPSPFRYYQRQSEAGTQLPDLYSIWFGCVAAGLVAVLAPVEGKARVAMHV
jgi:hypothetical protein